MLVLILCSAGWLLALIPAAGALMATISASAGRKIQGHEGRSWLFIVHVSFFPVVILSIIIAWIAAAFGAWSVAYGVLLLPLVIVIAFAAILMRG